jgi:hypothetical protein
VRSFICTKILYYRALRDLFYLADLSGNAAWFETFLGRERGEEGEWEDTLLPPIPPILPLLPVLALKKSRTMLRCQINRLNKTDPEEPYTFSI